MSRCFMAAVLLVGFFQPSVAHAVKFKVMEGLRFSTVYDQREVPCHDLKKYLDRFPLLSRRPPEIPAEKGHSEFEPISWRFLDPKKNITLIRRIVARLVANDAELTEAGEEHHWEKVKSRVLLRIARGRVSLWVANLDINNDGKTVPVYRYGYQPVVTAYPKTRLTYHWKFFIGIPGKSDWRSLPHMPRGYTLPSGFDAFRFRGQLYLYSNKSGLLWIGKFRSWWEPMNVIDQGCIFGDITGVMTEPAAPISDLWIFQGYENPACRALASNIKQFPKLPWPMAEIPIHPESAGMAAVSWEKLDLEISNDLLQQIHDFQRAQPVIAGSAPDNVWLKPLPTLLQLAKSGQVDVQRARFDLDNDGVLETVYRYGAQPYTIPAVPPRRTFYWQYFLLPETQVQEGKKVSNKILALSMAGQFLDAFRYQKKTYLARLDYGGGGIEIRARGIGGHFRKCIIFPIRQ